MSEPGGVGRLCRRLLSSVPGSTFLLLSLAALTVVLGIADPRPAAAYLRWLDLKSLAGLLALLVVAQGVRESGYVQWLARHMLARIRTLRSLAFVLLGFSAVLAMFLTNDVSLFLIVPLTLVLSEGVALPRQRLVIFEALAVNAGSALSPVGNPQNLLLWNQSGVSMPGFVGAMFPAFACMMLVLVPLTWWAFPARALSAVDGGAQPLSRDTRLAMVAFILLPVTLLLLEFGQAFAAGALAVIGIAAARLKVLRTVDWPLLVTIALMLLGLGHLSHLTMVRHALLQLDWRQPWTTFLGGIGLSQIISNVPATVALRHVARDPLALAVAVNTGGFGLVIGSLANLIALRLEGSRGIWWRFHLYAVPFLLVVAALIGWWVLQ